MWSVTQTVVFDDLVDVQVLSEVNLSICIVPYNAYTEEPFKVSHVVKFVHFFQQLNHIVCLFSVFFVVQYDNVINIEEDNNSTIC